jgi:alkanesulfonate monooxygenase SsuD/methylene tetrahydromethanopterin reductase-like flavin-dependent oxidoreductase (luciferase family)
MAPVSFGIATAPQQVDYDDIVRVWREADAVPEIEHAWLFDHLMPIASSPLGPIFEGWTLLSAVAAQTSRLRLGLLVTSNRIRPPAVVARIATTVDTTYASTTRTRPPPATPSPRSSAPASRTSC